MNWLAHLALAASEPAFRVGTVLADILPVSEARDLPEPFRRGVEQHRAIDVFTDAHPIFKRSVARLEPPFRRYGGIVIDVFFDHALSVTWPQHQSESLDDFIARFDADVDLCKAEIPESALSVLMRMRQDRWLASYGDLDGVRLTLDRISRRLRRPFALAAATDELARHYDNLRQDFAAFFPEVRARFRH